MPKRGKFYLKKYASVSEFEVWIVDGNYIRKNLDEEFTNFGQHYRFKFIPKNEFWIDKDYGDGREEEFYIDHMLVEHRLMKQGKGYKVALTKANAVEKRERKKSEFSRRAKSSADLLKKVHLKLLKSYSNKISVWIVDGAVVRDLIYIDFTEGGHDAVYSFVPKNEVWIDDSIKAKERKFIILHELHERNLMINQGFTYNSAHRSASSIEHDCRLCTKKLDSCIKAELSKCKKV